VKGVKKELANIRKFLFDNRVSLLDVWFELECLLTSVDVENMI